MPHLHISTIELRTFDAILSRYSSHAPKKLQDLDKLRYETIPATFATRRDAAPMLTKDEVEKLVEWKLKHGTFRPKLLSLVQSNSTEFITKSTKEGFERLADGSSDRAALDSSVMASMKIITQLKGIGPATASLLLSVMRPDDVPFFSDELFRWCAWDSPGSPNGWKRGIKYNVKEFAELLGHVGELRKRLGYEVRAVDIERVAWVLGKESAGVGADDEIEEDVSHEGEERIGKEDQPVGQTSVDNEIKEKTETSKEDSVFKKFKKGIKRSASVIELPTEGVRKSRRIEK